MKQSQQATLAAPVSLTGIGVHSGKPVNLHLHPAQANHGIVFLRTGLPGGEDRLIDATSVAVTATELCTVIGDRETGAVATIEHLMSCLFGLGIDNLLVEIDEASRRRADLAECSADVQRMSRDREREDLSIGRPDIAPKRLGMGGDCAQKGGEHEVGSSHREVLGWEEMKGNRVSARMGPASIAGFLTVPGPIGQDAGAVPSFSGRPRTNVAV